jgi:DNA-binding transcriptional ArsR family regulator
MAAASQDVVLQGRTGDVARYILGHEGAHFREVQRNVGLGTGQADHHLRRLVQAGLVARTDLGGEAHFFPSWRSRGERRPIAALRHPARADLVRAMVRQAGVVPLRALIEATGEPESTALHHLRTLVRAGVVYRVQAGRHVAYGLSDPRRLARWLDFAAPRAIAP